MVNLINEGVFLLNGNTIVKESEKASVGRELDMAEAKKGTIAHGILEAHNVAPADSNELNIKFDAMASHDITYVGIIQTARASGLKEFPIPYVMTNCHNSLCAVGGTINEDDHVFGLSAAKKYGGIFVPAHQSVIHSYMREEMAGCGKMILGSDSHTRYGALGTVAVGEGGPELVKQLLNRTYDIARPGVVLIYLTGTPKAGVGPHDVALAIIKATYANGFVKNKIMEFAGPGVAGLSMEFRNGIDVMTTETTCLSSIWVTDEKTQKYLAVHGRANDYKELAPADVAYYDSVVEVDLSKVESMIALPFHPSNAYTINEFNENTMDILKKCEEDAVSVINNSKIDFRLTDKVKDGRLYVDQGVIAGCSGGIYENIMMAAKILESAGNGECGGIGTDAFWLSVYPASQPANLMLTRNGTIAKLIEAGATIRTAFCGPCFGAGDVPSNQGLSIRHTTRNFPNREGSKPGDGQISSVALMDARSIAATAANGGRLTAATEYAIPEEEFAYEYDRTPYEKRVYFGYGKANDSEELKYGPNIADWPKMPELTDNLVLEVASVIHDEVTTTDELIPSGETSSYRSNPLKLASFALSRKDPEYVGKAQSVQELEIIRERVLAGEDVDVADVERLNNYYKTLADATGIEGLTAENTGIGSTIYANKPGDGSAREQAASCQKVLGGWANLAKEYATKRYRSNLVNWGMLPFIIDGFYTTIIKPGHKIVLTGLREALINGETTFKGVVVRNCGSTNPIKVSLPNLSEGEKEIILDGCLINNYKK